MREIAINSDNKEKRKSKIFEIGTAVEDNKRIQLRAFEEAEKEVLQILNIYHKPRSNRKNKTIWEHEIENAVERGVVFKSIYPINCDIPVILRKLNKKFPEKFQVKRLNTNFIRCDIIDYKKILLKIVWEDPLLFGGVIFIENERLAENLKNIFEELWERGEL